MVPAAASVLLTVTYLVLSFADPGLAGAVALVYALSLLAAVAIT